jgi:glycosyltransferase involved in cell wall biosynthesis
MIKITAIVPTLNEEHNIERVLASVQFADEIMVVDSFSTDNTLALAKKYTKLIIQRDYKNSASQKNWAIPQAKNDWILLVDADEIVTPELQKEIEILLESKPAKSGYWIYRINHFMGERIKYSGWQADKVIRLFDRTQCKYEEKHVHAEIISTGEIGVLENKLLHYTYTTFDDFSKKLNRYAWWQARDYDKSVKRITIFHIIIKPLFRFFKNYIIQLGFLDGMPGFIIAYMQSYGVMTRYFKLWMLRNGIKK